MSEQNLTNSNLYKALVALGRISRTGNAKRGAVIELVGNKAYMLNEKHSLILKTESPTFLGTGSFCSSDALTDAVRIQARDGKVAFTLRPEGKEKTFLVPSENPIADTCEAAFTQYFHQPEVDISSIMSDLNPDIILSNISVEGNKITLHQVRSDASVIIDTSSNIGRGFYVAAHPQSGDVAFYTQDLVSLQPFITPPILAYIKAANPISFMTKLQGSVAAGLIAWSEYSDKVQEVM